MPQEEKSKNKATNATEKVIHKKLFIAKGSSKKYDSKNNILYYGSTSHMVTNEENMKNL